MIRAFLAIDLPRGLRPWLAQVLGELQQSRADVRWVAADNIHLTLKFFGNITAEQAAAITGAAGEVAAAQTPFELLVTQPGAFPNLRNPRVVWLGLGGDTLALSQLFYRLEKAFAPMGFPPEDRAFNPHLTLGRVKSPKGRESLVRRLEGLAAPAAAPFKVSEMVLFKSTLTPKGSIYTPLQVIPLGEM
jgi:2'-5' RNA ligase